MKIYLKILFIKIPKQVYIYLEISIHYQDKYLGLGWSLCVSGEFLLIGAPYSSVTGGEQNGAVFAISSKKSWEGISYYHL